MYRLECAQRVQTSADNFLVMSVMSSVSGNCNRELQNTEYSALPSPPRLMWRTHAQRDRRTLNDTIPSPLAKWWQKESFLKFLDSDWDLDCHQIVIDCSLCQAASSEKKIHLNLSITSWVIYRTERWRSSGAWITIRLQKSWICMVILIWLWFL